MRVPLSWLKEYVDLTLAPDELANQLTVFGLEVGKVEYIGIPGGRDPDRLVWDRDLLILGRILLVEQHPNADKLVLATVDYGSAEAEVVVTGAPNLFPYIGQGDLTSHNLYTSFALEGAEVYDGHKEGQVKMKLKGKALRGIFNKCMVCSEKELGLGDDHDGVMLFTPADLGVENLMAGTPLQDLFGDAVLDVDIIPNIARCASVIGVAREVAALTGQTVRYPSYEVVQEGPDMAGKVAISTTEPTLNPRFVAFLIEGVEQKPSPLWMQRRLKLAGQRPINAVVDVSNYVMLEMGQPNHTFDYDVLRGRADQYDPAGPVHIITRLAEQGETLTTLDGQVRHLPDFAILVTDPAGNLSLGGVMGGANSEISGGTTTVLLEAAAWNFMNIRRTANHLKMASEAGFRFSRGVHPSQAILGAKRAAELLRRYAGGTVAKGLVDYYPNPPAPAVVDLSVDYVRRWSGLDVDAETITTLLEKQNFVVEAMTDGRLRVTAPDYRIDIEGQHDLVEEVCRMFGYDNIPSTEISDVLPPQRNNTDLDREERVKDVLANLGLQEIITYRLTTPEREGKLLVNASPDDRPYLRLQNVISQDRVAMRHSLLASVVEIAAENSKHAERIALFEVGKIYIMGEDGNLPDELRRLAMVYTGQRTAAHWQEGLADPPTLDFFDLKGVLEGLFEAAKLDGIRYEAAEHPTFRPGKTARIWLGEKVLGWLGELHPLVVEKLDFRHGAAVLAADLDLDLLIRKMKDSRRFSAISSYPPVQEDLAVLVDKGVSAAELQETITKSGGALLANVALFDVYEGSSIPAGQRSLAFHLTYQARDKTLKDKDVAKLRGKIIAQLASRHGAKLRE